MSSGLFSRRKVFLSGAAGGAIGFAGGTLAFQGAPGGEAPDSPQPAPGTPAIASVRSFGARGDGRADDSAAIQAAIDSVTPTGGEVHFEPGRYLLRKRLEVRSLFPVSLLGWMAGQAHNPRGGGAALIISAPMEAMIEYSAPDPAERNSHGAGVVHGLAFVDETAENGGRPGRFQLGAALSLRDFALGLVEGCSFHWLRGSAIQTEYAVMASVKGCRVRYCGDRDRPHRSAIAIGGSTRTFTTQSFVIEDCRVEVCYSRNYVSIASPAFDVTLRSCFFEAATSELPESSNTFLATSSDRFLVEGCTFNRTDAVAVRLNGRGKMLGCTFSNGIGSATSLELTGDRCIVANCTFEDNREALSIDCSGPQNQIATNTFYYSGGVRLNGRGNAFMNNMVVNPRMTGPGYWLDLAGRGVAEGNRFDGNGADVGVGGIFARGEERVGNNSFDRWGPHPCIEVAAGVAKLLGNTFTDVAVPLGKNAAKMAA